MKKFQRMLLAVALSACAAVAFAQDAAQAPQQALTPEQQAQLAQQDAQITQAAQQVVQLIDAGRVGDVWDMSTEAVKRLVPREAFVSQLTQDRSALGAVGARGQAIVSRSQFQPGGDVPEGLYLNVAFPTQFANNAQPVRELVSFRLDEDRVWRVSGYSLR